MENFTEALALVDDPIQKLKTILYSELINANSVAMAVLGWIIETTLVEPHIDELRTTADGFVTIKYSDEATDKTLCSLNEFLGQVRQLCIEIGLSLEEAEKVSAVVQQRMSDRRLTASE